MTDRAKAAAEIMRHLCEHSWHGYTQGGGRWGDGEGTCTVTVNGKNYYVEQGDRDCSSAVISAWRAALVGSEYEGALDSATYTGNMRSIFAKSGLFDVWNTQATVAQTGDVYLNDNEHTAMCLSPNPDMLGEFVHNEFGGIVGGATGDQTGGESIVRAYYDYPWNCTLHYNGKADSDKKTVETIETDRHKITIEEK